MDRWKQDVEAYLAPRGSLSAREDVDAAIMRTLAAKLDRLAPSGSGWRLSADMSVGEAVSGVIAELDAAILRGHEEATAGLRAATRRFAEELRTARDQALGADTPEGAARAYGAGLDRAIDELAATSEMLDALEDPDWPDRLPRDDD
jgi:hypothetical protein